VLTILTMPLAYSISTGIGLGLIALAALAIGTGHRREVTWVTYALAAVFLLHFLEPLILKLL
jgi:AGZA family xanthine/uracil permease-like MFS transporter